MEPTLTTQVLNQLIATGPVAVILAVAVVKITAALSAGRTAALEALAE